MILGDFFSAFQAGKELANATTWKKAQVVVAKLSIFMGAFVSILGAFGYAIPLTPEQIGILAGAVGVIVGLFNGTATVVSTSRIGLPSGGSDVLPGTADRVRYGTDEGRQYDWINELDDRNPVQVPDMKDAE